MNFHKLTKNLISRNIYMLEDPFISRKASVYKRQVNIHITLNILNHCLRAEIENCKLIQIQCVRWPKITVMEKFIDIPLRFTATVNQVDFRI